MMFDLDAHVCACVHPIYCFIPRFAFIVRFVVSFLLRNLVLRIVLSVLNLWERLYPPQCGETALILAAQKGHIECACLLMASGADKEAKDNVRENLLSF